MDGTTGSNRRGRMVAAALLTAGLLTMPVGAMHIAEGFLPIGWSAGWTVCFLPFLLWGMHTVRRRCAQGSRVKLLLAMAAAYCFVLSALKLPSITASSSHPTGTGLGTILFGPSAMAVVGLVVLLFQALLLAHGGLTTLGANAFSMAVAGPFVGYAFYRVARRCKAPDGVCVFLCAFFADLSTYVVTSGQLALAFSGQAGAFGELLARFLTVFAVTQLPLAVVEGILTVVVYRTIRSLCAEELRLLAA